MKQETIVTIEAVAKADPEASQEQIKALLLACKPSFYRRNLINTTEAMRILSVSRPTLRKYILMGKLTAIRISARKTRFALDDVERLAYTGSGAKQND